MELAKASALQVQSLLATASMLSILILVLIVALVLMLVLRAQSHQENNNRFPTEKSGVAFQAESHPVFCIGQQFFRVNKFSQMNTKEMSPKVIG